MSVSDNPDNPSNPSNPFAPTMLLDHVAATPALEETARIQRMSSVCRQLSLVQLPAEPSNCLSPSLQLSFVNSDLLANEMTEVLPCGRPKPEAVGAEAGNYPLEQVAALIVLILSCDGRWGGGSGPWPGRCVLQRQGLVAARLHQA